MKMLPLFFICLTSFASFAHAYSWSEGTADKNFHNALINLTSNMPVEIRFLSFETKIKDMNPLVKGDPEFRVTVKNEVTKNIIYTSPKLLKNNEVSQFVLNLNTFKDPVLITVTEVNTWIAAYDRTILSYSTAQVDESHLVSLPLNNKNTLRITLSGQASTKALLQIVFKNPSDTFLERDLALLNKVSELDEKNKWLFKQVVVREGYTLREHTLRVLETYERTMRSCMNTFKKYLGEDHFHALYAESKVDQLPLTLVFHDIGKPYAVELGESWRQHEFTTPMIHSTFPKLNRTIQETKFAEALVDHDIIGDLLMNRITADKAYQLLKTQAAHANMPLAPFFFAQIIYYTSDAGAYPFLASKVFEIDGEGCFVPKLKNYETTYWKLWQKILGKKGA